MKFLRIIFFVGIFSLTSCGFEDNLPCKASECENIPEPLPNTEDEG